MIQETRRHILEILKDHSELTVDEIVDILHERVEKKVTAATVRHHLDVLKENGMVETPEVRRRDTPGRPQYVFVLTEKAGDYFPSNYAGLAEGLLSQIKAHLPGQQFNVILEGTAREMAAKANIPEDLPFETRLDLVIEHLTEQGYQARWQPAEDGFLLETSNCPYEKVVQSHDDLCMVDMYLISTLLGIVPRRLGRRAEGDASCSYFIPMVEELAD
ncbi:MAG: ArsR family transcriptional regulator [Chloroflexi bacterium]|nr:ArsR family transcriptional regulator [Chloroflexota bacterium]